MADQLSPEEFQAVAERYHKTAPPGLSQDEFERGLFEAADNEARAKAASVRPAGADIKMTPAGVVSGFVKQVAAVPRGLYDIATTNPLTTIGRLYESQVGQAQKGFESAAQGRGSEAFGHWLASMVPLVGPAAADVGERMVKTGDVGGGIGEAAALSAMSSPSVTGPVLARGGRALGTVGRAITRPTQWSGVGMSLAGHPIVGPATIAAPYLMRGAGNMAERVGGSMEALARRASPTVSDVVSRIADRFAAPEPYVPARGAARPTAPIMEGEIIPPRAPARLPGRTSQRVLPQMTPETGAGIFGGETGGDFVRNQPLATRAVASAPEGLPEFQKIETGPAPPIRGSRSVDTGFNPDDVALMREMIQKGYDAKTAARIAHVPAASLDALMRAAMPSRMTVLNRPLKP